MCQTAQVGYLSTLQIGLTKKFGASKAKRSSLRIANSKSTHASVSVGLDKQELWSKSWQTFYARNGIRCQCKRV